MKRFVCFVFMAVVLISSFCLATGSEYFYLNESGELVPFEDMEGLDNATLVEDEDEYYDMLNDYSNTESVNQEEQKAYFDEQLTYMLELQEQEDYEKMTVTRIVSDLKTEYYTDSYYGGVLAIVYQTAMIRDTEGVEYPTVIMYSVDMLDNEDVTPLKVGDSFYGYKDVIDSSDANYNMVNHGLEADNIAFVYIAEQDRSLGVCFLLALTLILLLLYAGKNGAKALISLFVIFDLLFFVFVPFIESGISALVLAILFALEFIVLICVLKNGWSKKTLCAIIASTIVVTLVSFFAWFFVYTNRIESGRVFSGRGTNNPYYVQYMFNETVDAQFFYVALLILISSVVTAVIASKLADLIERYSGSKDMVNNIIDESKTIVGEYPLVITIIFAAMALPKFMTSVFDQMSLVDSLNSETIVAYLSMAFFTIIACMIVPPVIAFVGKVLMGNVEVKQINDKN